MNDHTISCGVHKATNLHLIDLVKTSAEPVMEKCWRKTFILSYFTDGIQNGDKRRGNKSEVTDPNEAQTRLFILDCENREREREEIER